VPPKVRKLDARLDTEAKKARDELTKKIASLRERARKLALGLKSTLGDADKREQALKEARPNSQN